MNTHSRTSELVLLIIVGIALAILGYLYLSSHNELYRRYEVQLEELEIPTGQAAVAEGERLARIRGCFWCHGADLEGQQYFAEADRGIFVVAPNLTAKIREYTPAEFARAFRHGVKRDGTSVQPAMPAFAYYNMSDADTAKLIAYVSSLPEKEGFEGEFRLMPLGWYRWWAGRLPPNAAELIDHDAPRPDPAVGADPVARGRYLAESICTECHGDNGRLRVPNTPDLVVAAAYNRDDFFRLMRTGVPVGERKIDYHMVDVSKYRYTAMTDEEIDALHSYFRSLAGITDLQPAVGESRPN
jgi:mono/diheme cytochrome c family protein